MRSVRCAWRSSNRRMSWGFARANTPSTESASLSGWKWGRFVRCATCQSCSWRSSRGCPRRRHRRLPYSSPCQAWRTWCSPDIPNTFILHFCSLTYSTVQVLNTRAGWTAYALFCSVLFPHWWIYIRILAILRRLLSPKFIFYVYFYFFHFLNRIQGVMPWSFRLFHTKALFFWGHQHKRRQKTTKKNSTRQQGKKRLHFFVNKFFFNKHFTWTRT